jgi:signal transduction histidine kinase
VGPWCGQKAGVDMKQYADGWQEPEISVHAMGSELRSESGSEPDSRLESRPEAVSSYLPWLESVAPRKLREEEQGPGHSRIGASLHPGRLDPAESLAALLHDTRNMVSAIDLYCDLLEEPGVLSPPFRHYAGELRLVGGASRRLLEKLAALNSSANFEANLAANLSADSKLGPMAGSRAQDRAQDQSQDQTQERPELVQTKLNTSPVSNSGSSPASHLGAKPAPVRSAGSLSRPGRGRFFQPGEPIQSLAEELMANQNIVSALAGPGVTVGFAISGGNRPIAMNGDDLTRILINLCRNAAEAMPGGGHIQVALADGPESLLLTFTDNGPGIPEASLEAIFSPGFTSHVSLDGEHHPGMRSGSSARLHAWPAQHRGLGLAIVRSIVSASGGSVWAANRIEGQKQANGAASSGAVITLEFPLIGRRPIS